MTRRLPGAARAPRALARSTFRPTAVALALVALAPPAAWAAPTPGNPPGSPAETELPKVVVTATRVEADADNVPATVTAVDRAQLDRRLPAGPAGVFADEPDIAVSRDVRRFGATRPNIRGLEDNRVVQQVDGVRLTDYYNGGGPTNFTMSTPLNVVNDFLKRVEVVRGAASSLYGSDAIGGVVGYFTLDPADLLGTDRASALRARATYLGANHEQRLTAIGALRGEATEFLVGVSIARAHETGNRGDDDSVSATRTRPNPQVMDDRGVLAKAVFRPAVGHRLMASVEGRAANVETEVLRLSASLPRVTAMSGEDHGQRVRASLEWEHKPGAGGWYDRLHAMAYRQEADTENHNQQRRSAASASCSAVAAGANTCDIDQVFTFSQDITGLGLQLDKALRSGATGHLLTGGLDVSRQQTADYRDATVYNLTTGSVSKSLAGDTFPLRDFPNGRTDTFGLFAQDEIVGLLDELSLTVGLRYDHRTLTPQVDALARTVLDAIGREAVEKSDGAWSPKLGALWRFSPGVAAYGQVARSYRAPNYNEVNGAFRNTAQSYGTTPNPDLKPETGVGLELGLKASGTDWRAQFAVFDNRYRDFIESVYLDCPTDPRCITGLRMTSMSVNLGKVRIHGAELRAGWRFAPGWHLDGAIAHTEGTDEETDAPLNSIEPTRLSLALLREGEGWGAEGRLRAAAKKTRVDDSQATYFRTPGYGVVDLSAWVAINRHVKLTAAVSNLFDQKYWLWSDVRRADAPDPAGVDFYSQPGRSLSLALQADF